MKKNICGIIIALAGLISFPIRAQNNLAGGIVYGDNWAYLVSAPKGWVMDSESWAKLGIYALFYKEGATPQNPNPLIYINSLKLKVDSYDEFKSYIEADLEPFRESQMNIVTEVNSGESAPELNIRSFEISINNKEFHRVDYYKIKDVVHMVVLVVFKKDELKENINAFHSVIKSIAPANLEFKEKEGEGNMETP